MEKILHNRIGYAFIALLIICLLGFYPTYISKFPEMKGFTSVHHFHGLMALLWILLLILQPFLIKAKKYELHGQIGKIGYIIMPLLVLSLFLVAKATYYKNIKTMPEADALAILPNGTLEVFYFSILFALAMYHRKNTGFHLRFMASTGLMMVGPGLGRMMVSAGLPFPVVLIIIILSTTGLAFIWMILDIKQKKSAFPMSVFVLMGISAFFINANGHAAWWQSIAKWWVATTF